MNDINDDFSGFHSTKNKQYWKNYFKRLGKKGNELVEGLIVLDKEHAIAKDTDSQIDKIEAPGNYVISYIGTEEWRIGNEPLMSTIIIYKTINLEEL